jgi:hypothetical protein
MSAPPTRRLIRPARRLLGLDQARAVAILAMLAAHFAPGVFAQAPRLEPWRAPILAFARLATPTFVVVFGVTVGFVYLPRYRRGEPGQTARHLGRRAAVMVLCATAIALPLWGRLAGEGAADPWVWLFGLYSVLLFYALALALLPTWLRWLCPAGQISNLSRRALTIKCVLAGAGLWAVGTAGEALVPPGPPSGPEFLRMLLVSGSFAYSQLMGTALVAIPVGVGLRAAWDAGVDRRFLGTLLLAGLGLAALGGLWGWAAGVYDPARLLSGELRTPPRAWYFLHIGGMGLALIPILELLTRVAWTPRPAAYLVALFGQSGLTVYTGHAFVLPGLALADRLVPLHGAARVAAALVPFAAFCVLVMYARHRRGRPQGLPRPDGRRLSPTSSPSSRPSASAQCPSSP